MAYLSFLKYHNQLEQTHGLVQDLASASFDPQLLESESGCHALHVFIYSIYIIIYNYMNLYLQKFCIFVLLMIFCVQRIECVKLQLWPWPTTGFPLERPWASRCCPPLCWRSRSKEERDRAPESGWRWEAQSYGEMVISQWFFFSDKPIWFYWSL